VNRQTPSHRGPPSKRALLAILALTLGALALRCVGLGSMASYRPEPDGQVLVRQFELIEERDPGREQDLYWQYYPHVTAAFAALLPGSTPVLPPGASLEQHLERAAAPIVHVRLAVAMLSVLLVPATWFLARRFLGEGAALFSAALVAVSLLNVLISQQARPHGPAAAFAVLAVAAAVRLARRKDWSSHVLAGLGAALALGSLQSGAAVIPALAAALCLRDPSGAPRRPLRIAACAALVALGALLAYPRHSGEIIAKPAAEAARAEPRETVWPLFGHPLYPGRLNGAGFREMAWTLGSLETLTTLLALAGLAVWVASKARGRVEPEANRARRDLGAPNASRGELAVVLLYAVPYALMFGLYEATCERFFLQLVPFLALLGGFAFERGLGRAGSPAPARIQVAVAALLLAWPSLAAVQFVRQRARTDTRALAARWIETHVEPETAKVFLIPGVDLPLLRTLPALATDAALDWGTPWRMYQSGLAPNAASGRRFDLVTWPLRRARDIDAALRDPLGFLRGIGAKYAVLDVPNDEQETPYALAFRKALREGAELVFRAPAEPGEQVLGQNAAPSYSHLLWSWVALRSRRPPGNSVEIYRLP
jgi:dolichyl-phosphate-mannose-protein mannosyltransferase